MIFIFRTVLGFLIAANCVGFGTIVTAGDALIQTYPKLQPWMVPVLAVLALISITACVIIWNWRRWGFTLLVVAYAFMLLINVSFGAPLAHMLLGPLGLIVLAATYWPVRDRFAEMRDFSAVRKPEE